MRLLMIGGTVFLGRAVVEEALARGHQVTVFHRGEHGRGLFEGDVERVLGDRRRDLHRVADRDWDLVVDTCAFEPADVAALGTERYVFVSSGSVYRDWPAQPVTTASPVFEEGDDYGAAKAATERALEAAMPGRVVHARAGVIVGPHENIGRLPWWLRRMERGGEVLAPGPAEAPIQLIDARDLAAWMLDAAPGVHNAAGPPGMATWGELLELCAAGTDAELVWVDGAVVAARVGDPWNELPLWPAPGPETAGLYAIEASLPTRPLAQTVQDTRAWLNSGGELAPWREEARAAGLDPRLEAELLAQTGVEGG